MEAVESANESSSTTEHASARLNTWVALTVAILATFMAICKVKDDNIVQAMQQAQADKVDHWEFYQARNIRQEVAKATVTQLKLNATNQTGLAKAGYEEAIARYETLVQDEETKKQAVRAQAEEDQKNYDALNFHDDQFDLADALIAIAISLLALTALTHKRWLYWLALIPTAFGVVMGLAGLLGWDLHPTVLTNLLQ